MTQGHFCSNCWAKLHSGVTSQVGNNVYTFDLAGSEGYKVFF